MKSKRKCNCLCSERWSHKYSSKHDSHYCETCNTWISDTCTDPYCEFCKDRPDKPNKENKMKFNRDSITKQFKNSPTLTVTFTKANGDERVMNCTVDLDLIPKDKHPKTPGKTPSDTAHTVWEIGTGWRSFKYENIISVEGL